MLLDISKISGQKGGEIPFEFDEVLDDLKEMGVMDSIKVSGSAVRVEEGVAVKGKGFFRAKLPCDRCLKPVDMDFSFDFDEVFSSKSSKSNGEKEGFIINSRDNIDLDSLVKESVVSVIPMKVVCSDNCKGLCPTCGKNLNFETCECDNSYINPKFESLRSLFNVK
jgi:uncharacterized protein